MEDLRPVVAVVVDGDDHAVVAGRSDVLEVLSGVVTRSRASGPRRWKQGPGCLCKVDGSLAQDGNPGAVGDGGGQLAGSLDDVGQVEEAEEESPGKRDRVMNGGSKTKERLRQRCDKQF